jgi:hypothetical protein
MGDEGIIHIGRLSQRDLRATPTTVELYAQCGSGARAGRQGRLNFDASPRLKVKHLVGIRKLLI